VGVASAMASKGSYVWDEWSDEEPSEKKRDERDIFDELNDSRSSFSSLGFGSVTRTPKSSVIDSATSDTISKLKKMQTELKTKQAEVKELHAEYQRIKAAKERKIDKAKITMEGKLTTVREQNKAALDKLEDMHQKLAADVHKLHEQVRGLQDRMVQNKAHQEAALEKTRREAQKRLARAKKQWEVDESVSFEKVMKSKAEVLEKQAAQALEPKLQRMVEEGKRKVSDARDSGEARIQQLQLAISLDHEKKLGEIRSRLTEQVEAEVDKTKRQLQRQHEETVKALQSEVVAAQEKFQREKLNLEQAHERAQRLEQEQLQDALQSISKREVTQTAELMEKQQREVGYLVETQTEALNKLKQSLREQQEVSEQRATQLKSAFREQQLKQRKEGIVRKFATETERILQKLREDAEAERAKIRRRYEERVSEVRDRAQRELDVRQEKEQRYGVVLLLLYALCISFSSGPQGAQ
jgi:myosin heavy subunit